MFEGFLLDIVFGQIFFGMYSHFVIVIYSLLIGIWFIFAQVQNVSKGIDGCLLVELFSLCGNKYPAFTAVVALLVSA